MQAVQIKENQKEVWNRFIAENSSESFLQAWEWGRFQESLGRKIWRLGIVKDNYGDRKNKIPNSKFQIPNKFQIQNSNLIAVDLIVKYDLPFRRSYLYCPRMMISRKSIKSKVRKVNEVLFEEIRKIAKKERAVFLRFDPAILMEHGTWNMEQNFPLLAKEGLGEVFKSPNEVQPKDTLILDLAKSEEELLKEMKSKTRYNIRLAMKKKLEIRNWEPLLNSLLGKEGKIQNPLLAKEGVGGGFEKDFEGFWKLMEETSRRDNFRSHNKNYYWRMLENLNVRWFHSGNSPVEPECEFAKRFHSPDGTMEPTAEQKFSFPMNLTARLYLAEFENKIIAANIVLFFGDYCVYLHGASSSEYRNLMAPYLLQWRQILDAKKMGCKRYDFWGVEGSRKSVKSKVRKVESRKSKVENNWGGITRFKKGFGGEEKNYIGGWDLVFDKFWYGLYRIVRRVKTIFNF